MPIKQHFLSHVQGKKKHYWGPAEFHTCNLLFLMFLFLAYTVSALFKNADSLHFISFFFVTWTGHRKRQKVTGH